MERIAKLRDNELKHIRFTQLLSSLNTATFQVNQLACPHAPLLLSIRTSHTVEVSACSSRAHHVHCQKCCTQSHDVQQC
jgi:hypothetical protein